MSRSSEVAFPLPVFHGCLTGAVIRASLAPLSDAGRRDLGNHLRDGRGGGLDRTGAGHVADGAIADAGLEDLLLFGAGHIRPVSQQDPVPLEYRPLVDRKSTRLNSSHLGI